MFLLRSLESHEELVRTSMRLPLLMISAFALSLSPTQASEDVARIADVQIKRDSSDQAGIYHIRVTIEHQDTGWDDYVEAWEITSPEGELLGVRPFFEPELDDTKTVTALAGVVIPEDIRTITIRARIHPTGIEGEPVQVQIPD
jgi:hypothetical protein